MSQAERTVGCAEIGRKSRAGRGGERAFWVAVESLKVMFELLMTGRVEPGDLQTQRPGGRPVVDGDGPEVGGGDEEDKKNSGQPGRVSQRTPRMR